MCLGLGCQNQNSYPGHSNSRTHILSPLPLYLSASVTDMSHLSEVVFLSRRNYFSFSRCLSFFPPFQGQEISIENGENKTFTWWHVYNLKLREGRELSLNTDRIQRVSPRPAHSSNQRGTIWQSPAQPGTRCLLDSTHRARNTKLSSKILWLIMINQLRITVIYSKRKMLLPSLARY